VFRLLPAELFAGEGFSAPRGLHGERGVRVERFDDRAIWELMYFGKARRQGVEI
jgi:hypothetical protein